MTVARDCWFILSVNVEVNRWTKAANGVDNRDKFQSGFSAWVQCLISVGWVFSLNQWIELCWSWGLTQLKKVFIVFVVSVQCVSPLVGFLGDVKRWHVVRQERSWPLSPGYTLGQSQCTRSVLPPQCSFLRFCLIGSRWLECRFVQFNYSQSQPSWRPLIFAYGRLFFKI